jgi:hypothetical protein
MNSRTPPEQRPTVFLERTSYRRRRLRDVRRLLPFIGALLFLVPLLWNAGGETRTAMAMVYLFGAWAVLIALAAILSRPLKTRDDVAQQSNGPD